jgi:hypothetical protein
MEYTDISVFYQDWYSGNIERRPDFNHYRSFFECKYCGTQYKEGTEYIHCISCGAPLDRNYKKKTPMNMIGFSSSGICYTIPISTVRYDEIGFL